MKRAHYFALAMLLAVSPHAAAAMLLGDADRGDRLHAAKCQGCHDTRVYTRPDRQVRSVEALMARVEFCDRQLKAGFTAEQQRDVVKFLNDRYYRFP